MSEPTFLTVKEVATILRVSEKSIYRHLKELPYFRFGGTILFDRETLLKALRAKQRP